MAKKAAIILCGCGSRDGSEIHESVLTLLALIKLGAEPLFYAPGGPQAKVINHITNQPEAGERDMLSEAARIARGNIKDIKELKACHADALLFPGGFGAANNLFTYAEKGVNCSVHPEVERIIKEFFNAKKPIGFICITPVLAARVLGSHHIELTAGNDKATAEAIQSLGAKHIDKPAEEIHVDRANKIVSTPAYMLASNIAQVESGISKLVKAVLEMV